MSPWVIIARAPLLDGEQLGPVGAVELLEAVHGHAGRARYEL